MFCRCFFMLQWFRGWHTPCWAIHQANRQTKILLKLVRYEDWKWVKLQQMSKEKLLKTFKRPAQNRLKNKQVWLFGNKIFFLKNEELLNFAQYCTSFLTCRVIRSWQVQYRNRLSSFDYFYHCMCISDLHLGM